MLRCFVLALACCLLALSGCNRTPLAHPSSVPTAALNTPPALDATAIPAASADLVAEMVPMDTSESAITTPTADEQALPAAAAERVVPPTVALPTEVPPTVVPTVVPTAVPVQPSATSQPATTLAEPMNVVQAGASIAVAAPAAQARNAEPVRLQIERIGLDLPLVPVGLDENHTPVVPKHDAAWYTRSARPGEHENMVFWGHALRFEDTPDVPAPFEQLRHLAVGDSLRVYAADGSVRSYVIVRQVWALPHEVEYIRPHGEEEVTIVCCIGDTIVVDGELTMTHRLITIAHPIQTS